MSPKDITFEQLLTSGVPAFFDAQEIIIEIFIPIAIIAIIIVIFLSNTSFFKKWVARNKKKKKVSIFDTVNLLGFKKDQIGGIPIIKGHYKGKDIIIYPSLPGTHLNLLIETNFYCDIPKIKHKLFPTAYFSLSKREEFVAKWNGFEKSFRTSGKINLDLSEKTKLNLEHLFCKKYFIFIASLKVKPPNSKKLIQMRKGKVVFDLPRYIIKDVDSLKVAMDIVVDVAKQMDEVKMGK